MVDKDASVGSEGLASTEETPTLLQLACILRDRLDDLIAGTQEAPGIRDIIEYATPHLVVSENTAPKTDTKVVKKRAVEGGGPCAHVCSQHPPTVDPAVWGRLPEELLDLIFARLPLHDICRLRSVSKHWNQCLFEKSRFSETCTEVHNKIFALIEEDMDDFGKFWVKLYDINTNKWHVYLLYVGSDNYWEDPYVTMSAADGGLVVFVSAYKKTKQKPLEVWVLNPLTRSNRVLQLEGVRTHEIQMVQIITDYITGHYKVMMVAQCRKLGLVAEVYFSERNKWVSFDWPPEQFFGIKYDWDLETMADFWGEPDDSDCYSPQQICMGPCVYNYAEEKLTELKDESYPDPRAGQVEDCALVKDRLFVLHEERVVGKRLHLGDSSSDSGSDMEMVEEDRFCVTEFRGQTGNPNWEKVRSINAAPFVVSPCKADYRMRLYACKGFLLVVSYNDESGSYEHEVGWLYDLSSEQWRELPRMREDHKMKDLHDNLMMELRWDMDPCSDLVSESAGESAEC